APSQPLHISSGAPLCARVCGMVCAVFLVERLQTRGLHLAGAAVVGDVPGRLLGGQAVAGMALVDGAATMESTGRGDVCTAVRRYSGMAPELPSPICAAGPGSASCRKCCGGFLLSQALGRRLVLLATRRCACFFRDRASGVDCRVARAAGRAIVCEMP